jgi:hypothetical protein
MGAWRGLIVLAAVFAGACGVDVGGKGHGGPYSVEIRSVGNTQVYVVRGPENKVAAARAGDGASAFLNADQLQHALAAMPTPTPNPEAGGDHVSVHAPGFDLRVQGDDVHINDSDHTKPEDAHAVTDDGEHHGSGQVSMNIGGFGMHVNADDGGPGDADDRAQVTLSGMSAHDARRFIMEQEDLSSQVQAQMIAALGLPADDANARDDHDDDRASDHLAGANDAGANDASKPKPDKK